MAKIRAVIVGFGVMGRLHFETLLGREGVEIVGIVRASACPPHMGVPVFTTLPEALDRSGVDLAIISTPHFLHYDQARLCLERGCHVLVEKPLTLRYCQAVELVDLARERQRLLIVGLQRRYEGFCRVFRRLWQAGALGSIQLIHGLFAHRFTPNILKGWRTSAAEAGAGVIDDSALHLVDLLTYFSGSRILGLRANVLTGAGVAIPHSFACIMETENGATLSASGSYLAPANSVQEEISIYGSCGSLFARRFCMQWDTNPPTVCYKSSGGTVLEEFDLSEFPSGKTLPLLAMIDVLQGRAGLETLHTEASQTLETHRVIEMIRDTAHPRSSPLLTM